MTVVEWMKSDTTRYATPIAIAAEPERTAGSQEGRPSAGR